MRRSGVYETEITVPIKIFYTAYSAEKMTMTYPGCPEHIEVEHIEYDVPAEIERNKDRINGEIMGELEEN